MKISELNTKSFLGAAGAASNSYVLINYEDENTNEPVTYKATVQELGKSIAKELNLTINDSTGLLTMKNSNGAWAQENKGKLVTASEKTKIANAASIGYVTAAVANAGGGSGIDPSTAVSLLTSGGDNSMEAYPVFIAGSNHTFYDGQNSGQASALFTLGQDRLVVYSSAADKIGYYDPGDSYFNELDLGGGDGGVDPLTFSEDGRVLTYVDDSGRLQVYDSTGLAFVETVNIAGPTRPLLTVHMSQGAPAGAYYYDNNDEDWIEYPVAAAQIEDKNEIYIPLYGKINDDDSIIEIYNQIGGSAGVIGTISFTPVPDGD